MKTTTALPNKQTNQTCDNDFKQTNQTYYNDFKQANNGQDVYISQDQIGEEDKRTERIVLPSGGAQMQCTGFGWQFLALSLHFYHLPLTDLLLYRFTTYRK